MDQEELNRKIKNLYDILNKRIGDVEKRKIKWAEIIDVPIYDPKEGHSKISSDIQLLFKNVLSIRDDLATQIERAIKGIEFYHKDLKGIGPDDHHPEKHILESHTASPLMTQLLNLIKNPPKAQVMRGGGATAFNQLVDVPVAYTGQAGKTLAVKGTEDGLEFVVNVATDEKVKASATDTTPGYLNSKISVSGGLTKSITSPAGNEVVNIAGPDLTSYAPLKKTIADKTDDYPVVVADTGKILTMSNAGTKTFTLPVIAAGDIGTIITFVKKGAGKVVIQANTGQYIDDSTSAGTIYDDQAAELTSTITLLAISTTQWVIVSANGIWITT